MANERLIYGLAERHYAEFVRIFQRYPQIDEVLIFGSRAKGTDKPWSDFDLAVVAPTMSGEEFARLWVEVDGLELVFKVDLLHWDKLAQDRLKEKICEEGRRFYPVKEGSLEGRPSSHLR